MSISSNISIPTTWTPNRPTPRHRKWPMTSSTNGSGSAQRMQQQRPPPAIQLTAPWPLAEMIMSPPPEDLAGKFLAEIEAAIDKHAEAYSKDARWHQFI